MQPDSIRACRELRDKTNALDLFLCHSHKDKKFVRRLARDLDALSVTVWYDDWELSVGDSLHKCIGQALERSAYVGVVLSPDSVTSHWCQDELDQALIREKRLEKKVVLPLLYRRVQVPPFLENRLYLDFSLCYLDALAQLSSFIHGISPRQIEERLSQKHSKTIKEIHNMIQELRVHSPNAVVFPKIVYHRVSDALEDVGIKIDPRQFEIRPHSDTAQIVAVDEVWFNSVVKSTNNPQDSDSKESISEQADSTDKK